MTNSKFYLYITLRLLPLVKQIKERKVIRVDLPSYIKF